MAVFLGISRLIDFVTGIVGRFTWWVSLLMVLIGFFNVITRYFFDPIATVFGTDVAQALSGNRYLSIQTFSFDLIFMLGAAYVLSRDGHVRVDIVYSQIGPRVRAWIDMLGSLLFLIPFSLFGIHFSRSYVGRSLAGREASGDPGAIPVYLFKVLIPIMFVILIVQAVSEIIKHAAFLAGTPNSGSIHDRPPGGDTPARPEGGAV